MSQEIIYTSAMEGLKPGSQGFCTVVSTSGMAKNLAERLESLSGYRHHYLPHDSKSHLNPVNFSHLLIKVGGRKYHVLGCIRNAGVDYTGRNNKLAHLVAIEPREAVTSPGGPAWVMSKDGFCETKWNGEVKRIASGRLPRNDDYPLDICNAWKKLTGDAGWAGFLAESGLTQLPQ